MADQASMKASPNRKGNESFGAGVISSLSCLNESPYEKAGKFDSGTSTRCKEAASMKAPPKRKGNALQRRLRIRDLQPSMKALPKRMGNQKEGKSVLFESTETQKSSLNEGLR